jgi:cobalt-precorrin-5B (C1)-methyltransferase
MKSEENYFGITTGVIATATSLAALKSIVSNEDIDFVKVNTPCDEFNVEIDCVFKSGKNIAMASAFKYPYNDPDVTVNHKIIAKVELVNKNENNQIKDNEDIIVTGGKGIGRITKVGLQVPVGKPAINPVPMAMIKNNLKMYLPENKIAKVEITVPDGEEIAKKTMNPRLGIVGGISILGTTGIARSFSSKAYKESLLCQLDIAIGEKYDELIFVPGNIGEKLALNQLNVKKDQIIQMGNFVGFMLKEAKKRGINDITLFGHIGKLVKIAGGIFNTKHKIADGRREIIACHSGLCGANKKIIREIFNSKTTEEMIAILKNHNLDKDVFESISKTIVSLCNERFNLKVKLILVDMDGKWLNYP